MAWAWFGLHRLDLEKGQWRPAGDNWGAATQNAHNTLANPPHTRRDEAKALSSP